MSSIQKLVNHWKKGQFIPGGKPPQPLNNEVKGQRLSELNSDDMIVPEIIKGISILKDVVEALRTTQEFNKDPSSFSGDARDVLMSDDFLLVVDVLRLIFPEGMISDVWLKRGRDEDLDTRDGPMPKRLRFTNGPEAQENKTPRSRQFLVPRPRFTNGPEAQENKTQPQRFTNGSESQTEKKPWGVFSTPVSQLRFTNGSESQTEKKPGLFGMPTSQIRFTNGSESQQEKKPWGVFSTPVSQLRFTNGSESQQESTSSSIEAKDKDSNYSPALQHSSIFKAKKPAPEYRGIFSQQIGFASNPVVSEGSEKVSKTPPTPPQTGGIFSTTSPGLEHTESSSQYISSLSGNNKEATLDNLLSSMGGDDVHKILAQLQLYQQGTKRKHEEEEETTNKKRNNMQEPHSLIEF